MDFFEAKFMTPGNTQTPKDALQLVSISSKSREQAIHTGSVVVDTIGYSKRRALIP
jgi:hypothetical protein